MSDLRKSINRVFVLSYDVPSKEEVISFLLDNGVRIIKSYSNSTIHFEWDNADYDFWYKKIMEQFIDINFSINVLARSLNPRPIQFFQYNVATDIERNCDEIVTRLKTEKGIK